MKYRPYGKSGFEVSALGFGCMRLPLTGTGEIDEPEAERCIKYAIENGVNYLDTAYPYHKGESEKFLGRALKGGWREKVKLVSKLPSWLVKEKADLDRFLDEQLERLQTDHLDVYLLHTLDKKLWDTLQKLDALRWLEKAKASGKIGIVGFSFHDKFPVFKEIVDAYDHWEMCQIQYNYMNENYQAGTQGLLYAAQRNLAVVIMEPLLGGRLANPPESIKSIWQEAPQKRSPAEWALQWLWDKPQVSIVLSGMSSLEQVQANIASAGRSGVGLLSPQEKTLIERVRDRYQNLIPIPCTACEYCLPCPNGVKIPANFEIINDGVMHADMVHARQQYNWLDKEARASLCIQCAECESKCPQHIPISQWMPYVHEVLGEGKEFSPQKF